MVSKVSGLPLVFLAIATRVAQSRHAIQEATDGENAVPTISPPAPTVSPSVARNRAHRIRANVTPSPYRLANVNESIAVRNVSEIAFSSVEVTHGEHESLAMPKNMPDLRGGSSIDRNEQIQNATLPELVSASDESNNTSAFGANISDESRQRTSPPAVTPRARTTIPPRTKPAVRIPRNTPEPQPLKLGAGSETNPIGQSFRGANRTTPNFKKVALQDGTWDLTTSPFSSQEDLHSLWSHLFSGYEKDLPPIPLDEGPLAVGIGINFMKIKSLDALQGSLDMALALRLCWDDARLSFDSRKFFNKSWMHEGDKLPLDLSMVWTPDITVLNLIGSPKSLSEEGHPVPLVLADDSFRNQTGVNVLWSRPLAVSTECKVDMSSYPFDQQVCEISLGSWTRSRRSMLLVPQEFFAEYTIHSSEFLVSNITVEKRDVYTKGSAQTFSEVVYTIELQRYPHYHVVNFIIPMLAITLLTIASMWMDIKQPGQRVNSGTKLLLCVVSIMFITARGRPALHGNIWIDQFQSHCLAMCVASVLENLFIDYVSVRAALYSWMPQTETIDVVLRSAVCFMTAFTLYADVNMVSLSKVPDCSSANLLMDFVYLLASTLAVSSVSSIFWLLTKRWWIRSTMEEANGCDSKDSDVPLLSMRGESGA